MNEYEAVKRFANQQTAIHGGGVMHGVYPANFPATATMAEQQQSQPEVLRLVNGLDERIQQLRAITQTLAIRLEHVVAAPIPEGAIKGGQPQEIVQSPLGNRIQAMDRDLSGQCQDLQALIHRLKV
jgi:hypothetical protein